MSEIVKRILKNKYSIFLLAILLMTITKGNRVYAKIEVNPEEATSGQNPILVYIDTGGARCKVKYTTTRDFPYLSSMFDAPGNNTQDFAAKGIWFLHVYNKVTGEKSTTGPYIRETNPPNKADIKSPEGWIKGSTNITINDNGDNGSIGYDEANDLWSSYTAGVKKTQWRYSDDYWEDYNKSILVNEEGWKTIEARVFDNVDNISEVSRKSFGIDNSSPIIAGTDIDNVYGWTKGDVLISQYAVDSLSGVKSIDLYDSTNKKIKSEKNTLSYIVSQNGISKYKIRSNDNVDNQSDKDIEVKIDKTPPEITTLINESWSSEDIDGEILAKDNLSGMNSIELYNNESKERIDYGYDTLWTYFDKEGISSYTIKASDNVGNSISKNLSIKIDKTAPTGKVNYDYNEDTFNLDISVGNVIETGSGVSKIWVEFYPEYKEKEKVVRDLVKTNNVYKGTTNLFDLFKDNIDPIEVVVKAIDKVGNERELDRKVYNPFKIEATISRAWEPYGSIFKEGELGLVKVKMYGGIDQVKIEFPEELNKLANESEEYSELDTYRYLTPKKKDEFDYKFYVPIGAENRTYIVKVTGYKWGEAKTVFPIMEVKDNILSGVRTRLR